MHSAQVFNLIAAYNLYLVYNKNLYVHEPDYQCCNRVGSSGSLFVRVTNGFHLDILICLTQIKIISYHVHGKLQRKTNTL